MFRLYSPLLLLALAAPALARGGGGCFPGDVPITKADGSTVAIRGVKAGDRLLAFTPDGLITTTTVHEVLALESTSLFLLEAEGASVRATGEHPFYVGHGAFKTIAALDPLDQVYLLSGKRLARRALFSLHPEPGRFKVYNLKTDPPNTFFAGGFAVHNKGGGGGGGGGHGGGGSGYYYGGHSYTSATAMCRAKAAAEGVDVAQCVHNEYVKDLIEIAGIFVIILVQMGYKYVTGGFKSGGDLDSCFALSQVEPKAEQTRKTLEFLARTDAAMAPDPLLATIQNTFTLLQSCWQERDYAPMQPLLMPDLYQQHCAQLESMKRNHEIDRIEGLKVDWVRLVHLRYADDKDQSQVTALIQAKARDYYVDDRNDDFLRGDAAPAAFQEFWTFQRQGGAWLLRQIDQTRESDALREANFVEAFTPDQLAQAGGGATPESAAGPVGTWVAPARETKDVRIHRMLNFLVASDPLWNEDVLKTTARTLFIALHAALEQNSPDPVKDLVYPEVSSSLAGDMQTRAQNGTQIQFRNLCVRTVDIVLVRNFKDSGEDEFTARVAAHAQKIVLRGGTAAYQDGDVYPFTDYYTFGRLGGAWKLKEILPADEGAQAEAAENIDQNASPDEVRWYYTKERAV